MKFKPGFRFSVFDAIILVIASCLALFLNSYNYLYSVLVVFIILHFFLFCNIVRMSRIPELIWASFFLCTFYLHLKLSVLSFNMALVSCILVTSILVFLESRKPSYHGIFWQKVNPKLPDWFAESQKQKSVS